MSATATPFDPTNDALYQEWRIKKLQDYPSSTQELLVELDDPRSISESEYAAVLSLIRKTNMALYISKT